MYQKVFDSLSDALLAFHQLGATLGLPHKMFAYEVPNRAENSNDIERHVFIDQWDDKDNNKVRWDICLRRAVWAGWGSPPPLMLSDVTITGQVVRGLCAEFFPTGNWERKFVVLPGHDIRPGLTGTYFFVPKDWEIAYYSGSLQSDGEIDPRDMREYLKTGLIPGLIPQ